MTKRESVLQKYGGHCAYCGAALTMKTLHVDHIIPKYRWHQYVRTASYNRDDLENLNPTCRCCNLWKHNWLLDEFRTELSRQVERARKYSRNFRMAERFGLIKATGEPVRFYFEIPEKP